MIWTFPSGKERIDMGAGCVSATSDDEFEVNAAAFAEYLASRKGLAIEATPITLSGLAGQQFDVGLAPGSTGCSMDLSFFGEIGATDRLRFIVLDTPSGGTLWIKIWYPDYDQPFLESAMQVVESFRFFDLTP